MASAVQRYEDLAAAMRLITASLIGCACGEERRSTSLELRAAVKLLKKMGKTAVVWKTATEVHDMLLSSDEYNEISEEKKYHRQIGGLLALSTFAISLGQNEIGGDPHVFLDPILRLCKAKPTPSSPASLSARAQVRYHAGEALFNLIKILRTGIMIYLDDFMCTLSDLAADCDFNLKMAAVMVDKLLKMAVLELEQELSILDLPSLIPLLAKTVKDSPHGVDKHSSSSSSSSRRPSPHRSSSAPSLSPSSPSSPSAPTQTSTSSPSVTSSSSSSSNSTPSVPSSATPNSATSNFDWGNNRYCVQFLLLSWLDLIVPQTRELPQIQEPPYGKIVDFIVNPVDGMPNYPQLNPVLTDITRILLQVALDDDEEDEEDQGNEGKREEKKRKPRDSTLRPSQMATKMLLRLVSLQQQSV